MGKRGPKPTPTNLLKIRGSWRAETRNGAPSPDVEMVACPSWLVGRAAAHWEPLCEMLFNLGLMSAPYSIGLALLVDALADWIAYTEGLSTATGIESMQYYASRKEKAWDRVMKACREFGITPSAATSVKTLKGDDTKPKGLNEYKLG